MYLRFLKSEMRKILKDPMVIFMLFSPLFFGALGRYLIPGLADANDYDILLIADYIIVGLALLVPLLYGALLAFSILDDRDDNILMAVKVSPLPIYKYLSFQILYTFILSFLGTVFIIWFSNLVVFSLKDLLLVSFLGAFMAPITGFVINVLASNKIEGFALMKGSQIVVMIPLISLFFHDYKELFFVIFPGFWPAKIISIIVKGEMAALLTYNTYYIIGLIYVIILNVVVYKLFLKKV